MAGRFKQYFINTKALVYAIAIHVAVVALLFVSFDWGPTSYKPKAAMPQVDPVKAKMMSEADVKKQMELLEAKENKKKQEELQAKRRLADLLKKQEQEKKRLADLQKKKRQEEKKAKALAEKRKKEEQRLARVNQEKQRKQREAEKRRAEEKRKAEEKRRQELAQKKERERQASLEAERKAQLEAQLKAEAEERRLAQAVDNARSRYIPIIQQKVDRNWTRPSGLKGLNAGVRVRLTPNGEVISAKVVRSSGNPVFDRSVENAVLKASPLPIPRERGVNEKFRDIQFNFDPDENLISLR